MTNWTDRQHSTKKNENGREESLLAFQARMVWFEDPNQPLYEIADKFRVTVATVQGWKSKYNWEDCYVDYKRDFLSHSLEQRAKLYRDFLEENYEQNKKLMDSQYELYECACQNLGLLEGEPKFELTKAEALAILNRTKLPELHKMILRNLEVPYTINDKQEVEMTQIEDKKVDDDSVREMIQGLQRALK